MWALSSIANWHAECIIFVRQAKRTAIGFSLHRLPTTHCSVLQRQDTRRGFIMRPSIGRRGARAITALTLIISIPLMLADATDSASGEEAFVTTDVESQITSVTVFRHQANVVREIVLGANKEQQSIRITGLPQTLRDQSVRWESDAQITVRSLRVSSHESPVVKVDTRSRDEQFEKQNQSLQDTAHQVAVIEQDLETLEGMVQFSSEKTKQDLTHSELKVTSVAELADFVMQRRRALAKELHDARREMLLKQRGIEESMRQVREDARPADVPTFDAALMVDAPSGGRLRLSYWVDEVSWEPRYTIHATAELENIDRFVVQLDGSVTQNSGENWNDVQLTFCTGIPNLQASSPLLVPLRVSVNQEGGNASGAVTDFGTAPPFSEAAPTWEDPAIWQRNVNLNTQAAGRQVHEINRQQSVQRELADDANNNLTDETYRVAGRINVADQTEGQAITIFRSNLSSPMYRVVTPLLSSFAFREAELENKTGQSLVGGDATVFLDGRFVGRTTLPPTAAGGAFTVGLGADRQVRTRRELLSRGETIQGGNRLSKLQYRLVISNYHSSEIDIRLFDRIPISNDPGIVNVVTDSKSFGKLSDDAKYLRMQRPTGILRWDLSIPAKRFGSDAYDHHYQYTVEMDRTRSIVSNDVEQQMRNDLRFNRSGGGGMGGGMGGGGSF